MLSLTPTMIRIMLFLTVSFLLASETTSFLSHSTRICSPAFVKSNILTSTTRFAEMGHLEPIPPPQEPTSPETPGVGEGAADLPPYIQEPIVDVGAPETPGLNRADWPSPVQEPNVDVGPPETPGLPRQTAI